MVRLLRGSLPHRGAERAILLVAHGGHVRSWLRQVGRRRFVYAIKVCELITHTKRFEGTQEQIRDFGYIADLLGPRMGCFLFQLPPSFHYTPARLRSVLTQLDH